jgi:hypothetical protein
MNSPSVAETFYCRSKEFIRRSLNAQAHCELQEKYAWSSIAIELLAKAALAGTNPALVIDCEDRASLRAVCRDSASHPARTISGRPLYQRLRHLFREFDARRALFCERLSVWRYSLLSGADATVLPGVAPHWERDFWYAADVLLTLQRRSFRCWLGDNHARAAERVLHRMQTTVKRDVERRTAECRASFERKYTDLQKRREAMEISRDVRWWQARRFFFVDLDGMEIWPCPSCWAQGVLAGTLWSGEAVTSDAVAENSAAEVEKLYLVEEFFCPVCRLHFLGADEIKAAGIAIEFFERGSFIGPLDLPLSPIHGPHAAFGAHCRPDSDDSAVSFALQA